MVFFDAIEKEKYFDENLFYDYRSGFNNYSINKYYCGTALLEMPFFWMAHSLTKIKSGDADGYSKYYPIFINIAALFYLFLGLSYLRRILTLYQVKEWHQTIVLFTAVFGTNLFYYTVGEPAMSHVFSFACISLFYYYSWQYFNCFKLSNILIIGILLGIIILIRPINGLIIFIWPFIAGSFDHLKTGIAKAFKQKFWMLLGILSCMAIVCIQLMIYKVSTGSFIVYSYAEEGFNFLSPHFIDILFSYKKGLFLYTPIFLVSLIGLFYIYKDSRFQSIAFLFFFILLTYIFSSWWMWYYGGSFSSRVYVEFIPLFMVVLAIPLNKMKQKKVKITYITTIAIFTIICQIQTFQYRYFQIHWVDMTKEKYWDVFLRVDQLL